jgi:hypothetical protein
MIMSARQTRYPGAPTTSIALLYEHAPLALFIGYSVDLAYRMIMKLRLLILFLALLAAAPASAVCLADQEARRAIAEAGIISLQEVMQIAVGSGGELVSARLCEEDGDLFYRVAVIDPDGRVLRLAIDAVSGDVKRGR